MRRRGEWRKQKMGPDNETAEGALVIQDKSVYLFKKQ